MHDTFADFTAALGDLCGKDLVLPMNTGAEAVETAVKTLAGAGTETGVLARPGVARAAWVAARREDARWAREYLLPWVNRRLRGTSSGDGLPAKRPSLQPVTRAL